LRELEIVGVLHRRENGAGERSFGARENRRRELLGIGVNGIAEQRELEDRHENHGGEGHAVAPHLNEFLDNHHPHAPQESRLGALGRLALVCPLAHAKLSFDLSMSRMNTSSRVGSPRAQRCAPSAFLAAAMAESSVCLSRPETCSSVPNGATISTPSQASSLVARGCRSLPETIQVLRPDFATTSRAVPLPSSSPKAM